MTEKQAVYRKKLLKTIHINPTYKQISQNEAWEDFLEYRFGVSSSAKLSIKELICLITILKDITADLKLEPDIKGRAILDTGKITPKQLRAVFALKEKLGWSEVKFKKLIYKNTGVFVFCDSYYNTIDKKAASNLITAIKKIISWNIQKGKIK